MHLYWKLNLYWFEYRIIRNSVPTKCSELQFMILKGGTLLWTLFQLPGLRKLIKCLLECASCADSKSAAIFLVRHPVQEIWRTIDAKSVAGALDHFGPRIKSILWHSYWLTVLVRFDFYSAHLKNSLVHVQFLQVRWYRKSVLGIWMRTRLVASNLHPSLRYLDVCLFPSYL